MSEELNQDYIDDVEDGDIPITYDCLSDEIERLKKKIDATKDELKKEELDSLRIKLNGIMPYQGLKMFFSLYAVFSLIMLVLVLLNTYWSNQAMKSVLSELVVVSDLVKNGHIVMNYDIYTKTLQELLHTLDFFGIFVGLTLLISLILSCVFMVIIRIQTKKVKVNDDEA